MGTSGFIWCQQWLVSNSDAVIKSVKISPGMGMFAGLHCSLCYPNKNLNYTRNFLIVDHFKVINSFGKALLYPCMYYSIDLQEISCRNFPVCYREWLHSPPLNSEYMFVSYLDASYTIMFNSHTIKLPGSTLNNLFFFKFRKPMQLTGDM